MSIFGAPGVGGSLGECQWCGESFVVATLASDGNKGKKCIVGSIFGQQMAFHADCAKEIVEFGELTEEKVSELRKGPLKAAISEMYKNANQ